MVLSEEDAAAERHTPVSVVSGTTAAALGLRSKDGSEEVNIRQWTQDVDFRGTAAVWPLGESQTELGGVEDGRERGAT